jgi:hypothetical protein
MSDNIKELESNLVRDVSNMMMISFLEGSISTLTSLKKSYEMYGEIDALPLDLLRSSIISLLEDQTTRLEAMKKQHAESRANF